MAATFTDLFLGYDMIRSLCGFLYCDDIINVALTSQTIHRNLLANNSTVNDLFQFALRCDGSSGVVAHVEAEKARQRHGNIDTKRVTDVECLTATIGPVASKACQICGNPVCKVLLHSV